MMRRKPFQRVQAALVAKQHFVDRKTKSEIADALGLSRFKVARLIDQALEEGIVRFVIDEPGDINLALSEALRVRYGLKAAFVLEGPDLTAGQVTKPLGTLAAQFLEEVLEDGMKLGVSWGRTMAALAGALSDLPRVDVVQVAGAPAGLEIAQNPVELVHTFAKASGGAAFPVYGPMWAADPALIERLRAEPGIARALAEWERLDALVVGIGSWAPVESCLAQGFPAAWRDEVMGGGVIGDICATLIDAEGREVASPLRSHGLCIHAEQLRRIPNVIGVAGGQEKAAAIRSALRGQWVQTLITDAGVARRLLE